jgi:hypothetical protein
MRLLPVYNRTHRWTGIFTFQISEDKPRNRGFLQSTLPAAQLRSASTRT